MSRVLAVLSLAILTPALSSCGSSASGHRTWTVTIKNYAFSPPSITIAPGDTVKWINRDAASHTATAGGRPPAFSSPALATNVAFRTSITKTGSIHYHCAFHPFMHGTITVRKP